MRDKFIQAFSAITQEINNDTNCFAVDLEDGIMVINPSTCVADDRIELYRIKSTQPVNLAAVKTALLKDEALEMDWLAVYVSGSTVELVGTNLASTITKYYLVKEGVLPKLLPIISVVHGKMNWLRFLSLTTRFSVTAFRRPANCIMICSRM